MSTAVLPLKTHSIELIDGGDSSPGSPSTFVSNFSEETSFRMVAFLVIVILGGTVYFSASAPSISILSAVALAAWSLAIAFGSFVLIYEWSGFKYHQKSKIASNFNISTITESVWVVIISTATSFAIVYFLFEAQSQELVSVLLLLVPNLCYVILKKASFYVLRYCWIAVLFVTIVVAAVLKRYLVLQYVLFVAIAGLAQLLEIYRLRKEFYSAMSRIDLLTAEIERLREEVSANELKHLIGNVAHDLKTPLIGFMGNIEATRVFCSEIKDLLVIIASSQLLSTTAHQMRDKILNIDRTIAEASDMQQFMLMTINRCMDYTKVTSGLKLTPHRDTVNLYETLLMPFNCIRNSQVALGVILHPLPRNICSHIITDRQWLQENLLCLLSNAVKYSVKGSVSIRIKIRDRLKVESVVKTRDSSRSHDVISELQPEISVMGRNTLKYLRVEVEDTGIGITDAVMETLFKPFKQAQRMAGGTGLGLFSLAKRVEALGGYYGVHSRMDGHQGSLFWFEVPYAPDSTSAELFNASPRHTSRSSERQSMSITGGAPMPAHIRGTDVLIEKLNAASLSILLVDDSLSMQKIGINLFRKQGHCVVTAGNGAEALHKLSVRYTTVHTALTMASLSQEDSTADFSDIYVFDVVLMDFQMPVMDGLEATRRLRQWERESGGSHQLVIGCSANDSEETAQEGYAAGIDAFLPKPFTIQAFQQAYAKIRRSEKSHSYRITSPLSVAARKGDSSSATAAAAVVGGAYLNT